MMKLVIEYLPVYLFFSILVFLISACGPDQGPAADSYPAHDLVYPETKKVEVADDYFGVEVADPYRWLEVDTAVEVANWVDRQNEVTFDYLHKIPFRNELRNRYQILYDYTKYSAPRQVGDYLLFYKNDGLQNQAVIYIMKKDETEEEAKVLIDP